MYFLLQLHHHQLLAVLAHHGTTHLSSLLGATIYVPELCSYLIAARSDLRVASFCALEGSCYLGGALMVFVRHHCRWKRGGFSSSVCFVSS